jgi:hypothetical protein
MLTSSPARTRRTDRSSMLPSQEDPGIDQMNEHPYVNGLMTQLS